MSEFCEIVARNEFNSVQKPASLFWNAVAPMEHETDMLKPTYLLCPFKVTPTIALHISTAHIVRAHIPNSFLWG